MRKRAMRRYRLSSCPAAAHDGLLGLSKPGDVERVGRRRAEPHLSAEYALMSDYGGGGVEHDFAEAKSIAHLRRAGKRECVAVCHDPMTGVWERKPLQPIELMTRAGAAGAARGDHSQ